MSLALKISRSIDNHIWKIIFSLDPSKFSENDRQAIAKFGEPEINVGGTFLGPVSREENKSYASVGGSSSNGTGAVFSVSRNAAGVVSNVVLGPGIAPGGSGYLVGDTVSISGQSIGGGAADNLTLTVTGVNQSNLSGGLNTISHTGGSTLATTPGEENKSYSAVTGLTLVGSGTGATFNVSRDAAGAVGTVLVASAGASYSIGDTIKLAAVDIGGTGSSSDIEIVVSAILSAGEIDTFTFSGGGTYGPTPGQENASYIGVASSALTGAGTGATFDVSRDASGAVAAVSVVSAGSGYLQGNQIKILGSVVGGANGTNDITITVASVTPTSMAGTIATCTFSGGGTYGPTPGQENASYIGVASSALTGSGTGATFNVSRNAAGAVGTVSVVAAGSGYLQGNQIKILGSVVGGVNGTNDITITVASVTPTSMAGTITTFTFSGGGALGPIVNPNQYTLPDKYIRIRSDLPFVQEFEARAGVFSTNTKIKAEAFEEAFIEKYTAAILTLRGMNDTFTGESIVNI